MAKIKIWSYSILNILLLLSLISFIRIIFDFKGIVFYSELAVFLVFLVLTVIAMIGLYNNVNWAYVLSSLIFILLAANLLAILVWAAPKQNLYLTLALVIIGFITSITGIEKKTRYVEKKSPAAVKTYDQQKYIASKTGNSYHIPGCQWAKKIKGSNRQSFSSEEDAKNSGYKPHSCIRS